MKAGTGEHSYELSGCEVGSYLTGRSARSFLLYDAIHEQQESSAVYECTRVGTLIVATIYLQLIQNRYMFRSFTVLQCSHQHCVQPVASDVEVVGYLQQRLLR